MPPDAIRLARKAFAWLRAHRATASAVSATPRGVTVTLDEATFARLADPARWEATHMPPSGTRWRCRVTDTLTLETYA